MTGIEQLQNKIESNEEFAKSLQSATNKDEFLQKIKDAGINVTLEELAETVPAEGELDDSALEAVSGGFINEPEKEYLIQVWNEEFKM